ncbi:hypothetical protein ACH495_24645 [Micromonospora sp. NPDC018662]
MGVESLTTGVVISAVIICRVLAGVRAWHPGMKQALGEDRWS